MTDLEKIPSYERDVSKATHFNGVKLPRMKPPKVQAEEKAKAKRKPKNKKVMRGAPKAPIVIDGMEFPDRKSVAHYFGVSIDAVRLHVNSGHPEKIKHSRKEGASEPPTKPVTIHGFTYPSYKAAAEALGLKKCTISAHVSKGTLDRAGARKGVARKPGKPPIVVDGMKFVSRKEVAAHFGVSIDAVGLHLRNGNPDKIKHARKKGDSEPKGQPVKIRGVTYKSGAEAARKMDLNKSTIYGHIKRGTLDNAKASRKGMKYKPRKKVTE